MEDWRIYIVRCIDGTLYCGVSNNVEKRIIAHNRIKGAKYTKTRVPVELVAVSRYMTKSEALRFERKVKKQKRDDKVKFLKGI